MTEENNVNKISDEALLGEFSGRLNAALIDVRKEPKFRDVRFVSIALLLKNGVKEVFSVNSDFPNDDTAKVLDATGKALQRIDTTQE